MSAHLADNHPFDRLTVHAHPSSTTLTPRYDGFFRKYGLRSLAEQRVLDIVASVNLCKDFQPRVCTCTVPQPLYAMQHAV